MLVAVSYSSINEEQCPEGDHSRWSFRDDVARICFIFSCLIAAGEGG